MEYFVFFSWLLISVQWQALSDGNKCKECTPNHTVSLKYIKIVYLTTVALYIYNIRWVMRAWSRMTALVLWVVLECRYSAITTEDVCTRWQPNCPVLCSKGRGLNVAWLRHSYCPIQYYILCKLYKVWFRGLFPSCCISINRYCLAKLWSVYFFYSFWEVCWDLSQYVYWFVDPTRVINDWICLKKLVKCN